MTPRFFMLSWVNGEDINRGTFGLALSSYSRYRSLGVYGAYRVALRSLPGLTAGGDGWHLGPLGLKLAELVGPGGSVQASHLSSSQGQRPEPEGHWKTAFEWKRGRAEFLPTVIAEPERFASAERVLVECALFDGAQASDLDRRNATTATSFETQTALSKLSADWPMRRFVEI